MSMLNESTLNENTSNASANCKLGVNEIRLKAAELRRRIVEMDYISSGGHIGGSLSASDVLATLFFGVMDHSPEMFNAGDPKRDRFVLSKGHISDGYYTILAMNGYFPTEELETYCECNSRLAGHPTNKVPGIEVNTGALGHGLSVSVGIAKAGKLDQTGARIYTLLGDGELAEGSVWEAAMAAAHFKLDHLTAIIDRNGLQIGGSTEDVMALENLAGKWSAFGWDTHEVDGHDMDALLKLFNLPNTTGKPRAIIAHTTKGKGISYMENVAKWHHGVMNAGEYIQACDEIDRAIESAAAALHVPALKLERHPKAEPLKAVVDTKAAQPTTKKSISARQAVTDLLTERAHTDKRIVALTSDARGSASLGDFAKAHPEQFIEVGIAEQNEVGVAAGLALSGKIPFVCAPASFLSARSYEQVKVDMAYTHTNVKLLAVSGGLSYAELGQTHHSLQDIATIRSLPGMTVIIPSDAASARALAEKAIEQHGPVYLRVGRAVIADLYDADAVKNIEIGKAATLRNGKDAVVIACGTMVSESLKAAAQLEKEGISLAVIDMHTIKPLDTEAIIEASTKYPKVITVEEHVLAGGLGSAVCETLCETGIPVRVIALPDENMVCGSEKEILDHYGMNAEGICREVRSWLQK